VTRLADHLRQWIDAKMSPEPPAAESSEGDELHRLQEENALLRALLAWGNDPCVYCGIQSCDMSRCARGFPGCWRSEDMDLRYDKRGWARWSGPDRRAKR